MGLPARSNEAARHRMLHQTPPPDFLAVAFEWILKGPPTATGTIAAQGELERGQSTTDSR